VIARLNTSETSIKNGGPKRMTRIGRMHGQLQPLFWGVRGDSLFSTTQKIS
jgi:hypothetical protein